MKPTTPCSMGAPAAVPGGYRVECACGWSAEVGDEPLAAHLAEIKGINHLFGEEMKYGSTWPVEPESAYGMLLRLRRAESVTAVLMRAMGMVEE